MGCSSSLSHSVKECENIPEEIVFDFVKAYKSIKSKILLYEQFKNNDISYKAFLISTKTIPKFMEIIEQSQVLENIFDLNKSDNNIYEDELKKLLKNYKLEENIKIYYDYNECQKLKNLNEEENKQRENEEKEENEENKKN